MGGTRQDTRDNAASIRQALRSQRRRLHPSIRARAAASLAAAAPDLLGHEYRAVLAYASTDGEVNPELFLDEAHQWGIPVFLPAVTEMGMEFRRCPQDATGLSRDRVGIPAPRSDAAAWDGSGPVLIIVPSVAVTPGGGRLGRGGGYYDRFLCSVAGRGRSIAPVYRFQVLDELPLTDDDWPVDQVLVCD